LAFLRSFEKSSRTTRQQPSSDAEPEKIHD
jgi:hypothetical protein